MMNYIRKIVFVAFTFLTFYACNNSNPDELFADSPSERISKQEALVKELLLSSAEGWKITYFTDDTQLGGFTYLMKFVDDKTVEMDSDFGETKGTITSSEWSVKLGSTVKLSFDTKNKIHELSDSDNSPDTNLIGQGYKGSFEFLYYGQEGEDLIFRANRGFNEVRFVKATSQDWTDLAKNEDIRKLLIGQLVYQVGNQTNFLDYNDARRFATNEDETVSGTNLGIGFTPTGIIVSPAIKVGNTNEYNTFILNDDKNAFISEDGQFTIALVSLPVNIFQNWSINVAEVGEVSDLFLSTFNAIFVANTTRWGETLFTTIPFGNTFADTPSGMAFRSLTDTTTGEGFWAEYNLTFEAFANNTELLDINRLAGGFNWTFYTHLDPLVALIVDNAPYKIDATPTEEPTVVILTSESNPDVWFTIRR